MRNKSRSSDWWDKIVLKHFTDEDWLENFRVSKSTFNYLCLQLQPKDNAINDNSLTVNFRKKIAVCLYFLASSCEYRVVGSAFGIHKSIVRNIVNEFEGAVNTVLKHYTANPIKTEAIEISQAFE